MSDAAYKVGVQLEIQGVTGLDRAFGNIKSQLRGAGGALDLNTSAASAGLGRLQGELRATAGLVTGLTGNVLAATAGFNGLAAALSSGLRAAADFDSQMTKIRQVASATSADISKISGEIGRLSTTTGAGSGNLAKIAEQLAETGLTAEQTAKSLESLARFSLGPTAGDVAKGTQASVAAINQFKLSAEQLGETLGSVSAVSSKYAVEASDIGVALQRAGAGFAALGGSFNEFLGQFGAIRATTREGAPEIATALKSIYTRLGRSDVVADLKELGINLRYSQQEAAALGEQGSGLAGKLKAPADALKAIATAVQGLSPNDSRFGDVAGRIGGVENVNRVTALLLNYNKVLEITRTAEAGQAVLLAQSEKYQDSFAGKVGQTTEKYLELSRALFDSKGFRTATDGVLSLANGLAEVLRHAGPLVPVLGALAAVRLAPSVGGAVTGSGLLGAAGGRAGLVGLGLGVAGVAASAAGFDTAGSTLSGAGAGAVIGSVAGPWGAAIGAAVGATYSFTTALKQAADDVRQSKIDASLSTFGGKIEALASSKLGNPQTVSSAQLALKDYLAETSEKNANAATGFFNGFDANKYAALQSKSLRGDLAGSLPTIQAALSNQADQLGRSGVGRAADQLARTLVTDNAQLVQVVARLKGVNVGDIEADLRKQIVSAQSAGRAEASTAEQGRSIGSFQRLVDASTRAADGLASLRERATALGDLFAGNIGAGRVSVSTAEPGQALGITGALGGEQGRALASAGAAVTDIERQLPSVLASALSDSRADLSTAVERGLRASVGGRASPAQDQVIQSVLASLAERERSGGEAGVRRQARTDVSGLAEDLLKGARSPLTYSVEFAERAAKAANEFGAGLAEAARQAGRVNELYTAAAEASLRAARVRAEIDAGRAGTPSRALDRISLGELDAPGRLRQEQLAGGRAGDAGAIAQRLAELRSALPAAEGRQQDTFNRTGGQGQEYRQAAEEVGRLKSEAENLVGALRDLADTSRQTASIQEKLNSLRSEEQGKIGVGEEVLTAGPRELAQIARTQQLVAAAAQAGNLDQFSQADRRAVLGYTRQHSDAVFDALPNSPSGRDLHDSLIKNSTNPLGGGNFGLGAAKEGQKADLEDELRRRTEVGAAAAEALANAMKGVNADYLNSQKGIYDQFLTGLRNALREEAIRKTANQLGEASGRLDDLRGLATARDTVRDGLGVRDQAGLRTVIDNRQRVQALVSAAEAARKYQGDTEEQGRQASSAVPLDLLRRANTRAGTEGLARRLADSGVSSPVDAAENYLHASRARLRGAGLQVEDTSDAADEIRRSSLRQSVRSARERSPEFRQGLQAVSDARQRVQDVGLDPNQVAGEKGRGILAALDKLAQSGQNLDGLAAEIQKAEQAVRGFRGQLDALKAGDVGGTSTEQGSTAADPISRATGGPVPGGPRGTDTVPAWLSPGEHVINAVSARANRGLLEKINAAKGPVYRADGGEVEPLGSVNFIKPSTGDSLTGDERDANRAKLGLPPVADTTESVYSARGRAGLDPYKSNGNVSFIGRDEPSRLDPPGSVDATNRYRASLGLPPLERVDRPAADAPARGRGPVRVAPGQGPLVGYLGFRAAQDPLGQEAVALGLEQLRAGADGLGPKQQERLAARAAAGLQQVEDLDQIRTFNTRSRAVNAPSLPGGQGQADIADRVALEGLVLRQQERAALKDDYRVTGGRETRRRFADESAGFQDLAKAARQKPARPTGILTETDAVRALVNNVDPAALAQRSPREQARQDYIADVKRGVTKHYAYQRHIAKFGLLEGDLHFARNGELLRFAAGGVVPGTGNTDSVPALLTPGEVVIPRDRTQRFAAGGVVGGGSAGGPAAPAEANQAMSELARSLSSFTSSSTSFTSGVETFSGSVDRFVGSSERFATAVEKMPTSLKGEHTVNVNVTLNGAEVLSKIEPEMKEYVGESVRQGITDAFKNRLPDAGV